MDSANETQERLKCEGIVNDLWSKLRTLTPAIDKLREKGEINTQEDEELALFALGVVRAKLSLENAIDNEVFNEEDLVLPCGGSMECSTCDVKDCNFRV